MTVKDYWSEFEKTGKIADYLEYKNFYNQTNSDSSREDVQSGDNRDRWADY